MMKKGAAAREFTGFLPQHADAFKEVARQNNSIIMSRAPGVFAPGLISEGYSSKGFHNKAKSCDWGPMAGFVCLEARFSKQGLTDKGYAKQADAIDKAIADGATPVQIFISDTRLTWLTQQGYIKRYLPGKDANYKRGARIWRFTSTMKGCKGDFVDDAKTYIFSARETLIQGETFWGLYFQKSTKNAPKPVKALRDPNWANIEVVVNPLGVQFQRGGGQPDFKKATTADYDLFAVWGPTAGTNDYERPVGAKDLNSEADLALKEDPHHGNVSTFLSQICTRLNQAIARNRWGNQRFAYTGGDMVHHSDEAGRPFIDEVDFPVIVFLPPDVCDLKGMEGQTVIAFDAIEDFRKLIDASVKWGYNVELNPGWIKELSGGKASLKQHYNQYLIQGRQYQGIL